MAGVTELVTWVDRHLMGLSMLTLKDVSSIICVMGGSTCQQME